MTSHLIKILPPIHDITLLHKNLISLFTLQFCNWRPLWSKRRTVCIVQQLHYSAMCLTQEPTTFIYVVAMSLYNIITSVVKFTTLVSLLHYKAIIRPFTSHIHLLTVWSCPLSLVITMVLSLTSRFTSCNHYLIITYVSPFGTKCLPNVHCNTVSAVNVFGAIRAGMEKTAEGDKYLDFSDETLERRQIIRTLSQEAFLSEMAKDIWTPATGDKFDCLQEPENEEDRYVHCSGLWRFRSSDVLWTFHKKFRMYPPWSMTAVSLAR